MKVCSGCEKEKSLDKFHKHKGNPDGFAYKCKKCRLKKYKKYYNENKEKIKKRNTEYRKENKEKYRKYQKEYGKKYYEENKEQINKRIKKNRKENSEHYKEYHKQWLKENPNYQKKWQEENKEKYKKYQKKYWKTYKKKRYDEDIEYRILCLLRSRLWHATKGIVKDSSTKELLGCSIKKLRKHIEEQFEEKMNWDNQGQWHIDHIKPCASFDLTDEEQQKECFHYTNLQPLWAKENLSKKDKYDKKDNRDNSKK